MTVVDITPEKNVCEHIDVLIVAAGFEERSRRILRDFPFQSDTLVLLIGYDNEIGFNKQIIEQFRSIAKKRFRLELIQELFLVGRDLDGFRGQFLDRISEIPSGARSVGLDMSGMPSDLMCMILDALRSSQPYSEIFALYTAADEYIPTKNEYLELCQRQGDEIDYVPNTMALEMAENRTFSPFNGYRSHETNACLALFAGYEAHRSTGVIEDINPSVLLLIYGRPPAANLDWRLDLSRRLHRKFERTRRCSVETVSTQDVDEAINLLDEYYTYLIDDYDLIVSPICSKMQSLAVYLFWERYPEVQLSFPIPIGYNPERSPNGFSSSYSYKMPSRVTVSIEGP